MAHSGLRYLIVALGAIDLVVFALGLVQKQAFRKPQRILGASFAGLIHLQVLLGLAVLFTRPYYPALIGHLVCMVLAAVVVQACLTINRRRSTPGFKLPLLGVGLGLLLIFGGVMAIGRGLFTMTAA